MAGKIIADIIESAGSQISLNVGNVTILTASSSGLTLTPTNNVNINVANSNVTFTTANVTGVATFSAGTAALPAITTTGDTNTGIFFPAADTIAFAEGGAEAVRINSSGNVGIGTSSPAAQLHVNRVGDGTFASTLAESRTKAGFILNPESTNSSFGLNISKAVDGLGIIYQPTNSAGTSAGNNIFNPFGGNVGIGTSSPTARLSVSGVTPGLTNGDGQLSVFSTDAIGADKGGKISFGGVSGATGFDPYGFCAIAGLKDNATASNFSGYLTFSTATSGGTVTERMRIDSSGNLLVGTTSQINSGLICSQGSLNSVNTLVCKNTVAQGGGQSFAFFANSAGNKAGSIDHTGTTTVAYTTSSDYRMKENIAPMTGALTAVLQLKPCTYTWKEDGKAGQGFIAHELQEVCPDCVSGEKDAEREEQYEVTPAVKDEEGNIVTEAVMGTRMAPQYQGIDTSFLVATLTAAIQELKVIVDAQAVEIAALKAK